MHIPGAFHYVKKIFGGEISGTPLQSAWKFVVHLQRCSLSNEPYRSTSKNSRF